MNEKQTPAPENIRMGAPYDREAFEALCREYGIWGTAEAALCAVFWRKATTDLAAKDAVIAQMTALLYKLNVQLASIGAGGVGDPINRTRQDHAVEHAEYMAANAESLLHAIEGEDAAIHALTHADDSATPEMLGMQFDKAQGSRDDAMSSLRSGIYEFRKHRACAALRTD